MKIKHTTNRILATGAKATIDYRIISIFYMGFLMLLSLMYPTIAPPFLFGIFLILLLRKKLNFSLFVDSFDISSAGFTRLRGSKVEKFIPIENIDILYVHDDNGKIEFYINNKDNPDFQLVIKSNSHSFIQKTKNILKLKFNNERKTSTGKIYKFVSASIIRKRRNHSTQKMNLDHDSSNSKSKFFNFIKNKNDILITNRNKIGDLGNNKLIIDQEFNSLKIHLSKYIPEEISIYDINNIRVRITQSHSADTFDLIVGELVAFTNSGKEVVIYHCEVLESNIFDFTLDEMNNDLIALKAIIDFEIFDIIDKNTENLDLDNLKENLEKQKDILPNKNDLTL